MQFEGIDCRLSDLEDLAKDKVGNLMIPQIISGWVQKDIFRKRERTVNWSEALNFLAGNQWIRFSERSYHW